MGVIMLKCKSCDEIFHEDNMMSCLLCYDKEYCHSCTPCELTFKKTDRYVCESCICDPLKNSYESDLKNIVKDLKMTKKAFLKVLKEEKEKSYNPDILIDEFKKKNQLYENDIKLLNDNIKFQESLKK